MKSMRYHEIVHCSFSLDILVIALTCDSLQNFFTWNNVEITLNQVGCGVKLHVSFFNLNSNITLQQIFCFRLM